MVGLLFAALGWWFWTKSDDCFCGGPEDVAKSFVTAVIDTPLQAYRTTTGSYPHTWPGLLALIRQPLGVVGWKGPYLVTKVIPLDPWDTAYHYRFPGVHNPGRYDCWSSGPDKIDGTADDIGNW